jgi:hypothetical protein
MNLDTVTTAELLAELEKREKFKDSHDDHVLYMGIIDSDGAESIVKADDRESFSSLYNSLALRARFNGQRRPIIYTVRMPESLYNLYNEKMDKGEYDKVAEGLRELSTFKTLGY